jgi:Family of unknown function (DUF6188)
MAKEVTELEDRWILPLRGDAITRIEAGEQTVFVLDSDVRVIVGEHAYFTEGPVTGPEVDKTELGQIDRRVLQSSVGARIASAIGFKSGALRIVLDNGWHLNVGRAQPLAPAAVVSGETALWVRNTPAA